MTLYAIQKQPLIAPPGRPGPIQIIPNIGPHEQIYTSQEQIESLVLIGLISYEPDYGPNANVYTPTRWANAAEVRSWIP